VIGATKASMLAIRSAAPPEMRSTIAIGSRSISSSTSRAATLRYPPVRIAESSRWSEAISPPAGASLQAKK
jgi:hypothetical protein